MILSKNSKLKTIRGKEIIKITIKNQKEVTGKKKKEKSMKKKKRRITSIKNEIGNIITYLANIKRIKRNINNWMPLNWIILRINERVLMY